MTAYLELHGSGNGNPPGVGGMATNASSWWIKAYGKWWRVTTDRSAVQTIRRILDVVGAEEWGPVQESKQCE